MADVFISYASGDRDAAARLAHALAVQGLSVWWDREIVAGQAFDRTIERELARAGSVVVLWSERSVASEWVAAEAGAARSRDVLVPARLAREVALPLEFSRRQTVDLSDWVGGDDALHPGFQALCRGVRHALQRHRQPPPSHAADGGDTAPAPATATTVAGGTAAARAAPTAAPRSAGGRRAIGMGVAALLVLGALGWAGSAWHARSRAAAAPAGSAVAIGAPASPGPRAATAAAGPAIADAQPPPAAASLAAAVAGTYVGEIVADAHGPSRSGVSVTLTPLDARTVRVTSSHARIAPLEIALARAGGPGAAITHAGGTTLLAVVDGERGRQLSLNPHGELAFVGVQPQPRP